MLMFLSTDLSTRHVTTTRYPQGYPQKSPRYPQMRLYVKASPVTRDALRGGVCAYYSATRVIWPVRGRWARCAYMCRLTVACMHDASRLPRYAGRVRVCRDE